MSWSWSIEPAPPEPKAVVCLGPCARVLMARLEAMEEAPRSALAVTAHQDLLLVSGPTDALPWVDGARYAAPRPEAPALWLPTHTRPDTPLDLLARAIERVHRQQPILLWPEPSQLVPLHRLLPATATVLQRVRKLWHG